VLVIWRILDKESISVSGPGATASGVEWGIFVALAVAALLTYAGQRIRAAHTPEPPLPADDVDLWMPEGEPERPRSSRRARTPRESRRPRPPDSDATRQGREARRSRSEPAAPPPPAQRRPRADTGSRSDHGFPAPEPISDPPTLRFGEVRNGAQPGSSGGAPGDPDPRVTEQFTDEQLTIPFDETDRDRP
jgi:hypothetical protein